MKPSELLSELRALPPGERGARLRAVGEPSTLLLSLADEVQRLTLVENAAALENGAMLAQLADECGDGSARARVRRAMGQAQSYAGRFEEALATCGEARRIAAESGDAVEAARAGLASMHALGELDRYDEALRVGEASRRALLDAGQTVLAVKADLNLGGILQNRGDAARALQCLERGLATLGPTAEPLLRGHLQNNRGEALLLASEFGAARRAFRAALDAHQAAGAALAAAIAEGNLADLAARQGDLSAALRHFEHARRRMEADATPSHLARLLAEQAEALSLLGLTGAARQAYADVLPRLLEHGLLSEAARARGGFARALLACGDLAQAREQLLLAIEAYGGLRLNVPRARAQLHLAEVEIAAGEVEAAAARLDACTHELRESPLDAASIAHHRGAIALRTGSAADVLTHVACGLAEIEALGAAPARADLHRLRGLALWRLGRPGEAIEALRTSIRDIERLRGSLAADQMRAVVLGNRLAVYEDLAGMLLDERGGGARTADAMHVVEQFKSRSLLDVVCVNQQESDETETELDGTPQQTADAERLERRADALRGELNALYASLVGSAGTISRGQAWHHMLRRRETELEEVERRRSATDVGRARLPAPARWEEIQAGLRDGEILIEYFGLGDEVAALIGDRRSLRVVRGLSTAADIEAVSEGLHFQIARASRPGALDGPRADRMIEAARGPLRRMHATWIGPLGLRWDETQRVMIVPHGSLHGLPLHAALDGGLHLIERAEVCFWPSASLLTRSGRPMGASGGALVVGVADDLAPRMADEARAVAAGQADATLLIGDVASVAAFAAAAPTARRIHLACHGRFDPEHPESSGLRLADRWLTPRDLARMRLQAELVVLSGCSTGRSTVRSGDEVFGLLRALVAGGASAIVASLWPVDDERTMRWMVKYYERLRDGSGAATALRAAQREAIGDGGHVAHWAAFFMMGAAVGAASCA